MSAQVSIQPSRPSWGTAAWRSLLYLALFLLATLALALPVDWVISPSASYKAMNSKKSRFTWKMHSFTSMYSWEWASS